MGGRSGYQKRPEGVENAQCALISLHVEKVTPLVLWIATPRKRCPGGRYLGAVHRPYVKWTLPA